MTSKVSRDSTSSSQMTVVHST